MEAKPQNKMIGMRSAESLTCHTQEKALCEGLHAIIHGCPSLEPMELPTSLDVLLKRDQELNTPHVLEVKVFG